MHPRALEAANRYIYCERRRSRHGSEGGVQRAGFRGRGSAHHPAEAGVRGALDSHWGAARFFYAPARPGPGTEHVLRAAGK